jgi:hypothetical protein
MQNRYVGDVGDYGKFALLRKLTGRANRCVLVFTGIPPDTLYFADEYPRGLLAPEIEVKSVPKTAPNAGKYVYWDELRAFWDAGQSLVIYHHLNRTMSVRSALVVSILYSDEVRLCNGTTRFGRAARVG